MRLTITLGYLIILLASIVVFFVYLLGGVRYVTDVEENTCDLTYMFEYPQYVKIELDDEIEKQYPKYGLYAYGEGYVTVKLRRKQFTGIPVLFVPGNAGSHEQVRSLASVSLRLAQKRRTAYHFDYFSVSLAEGYSAFYGGILADQTAFVSASIRRILSLYKRKIDKVILIGHSMGGIIAKAALFHDNPSNETLASLVITLATPFTPQLALDKTFLNFLEETNLKSKNLQKMGTTVISIGGGSRDVLVASSRTLDPHADLNLIGSVVPDSWSSLDHLSILWCRHFVIALVRALFDSVDIRQRNPRIFDDSARKIEKFNYHLINRFSGKHWSNYEEKMTFDPFSEWIEVSEEQFTFKASEKSKNCDNSRESSKNCENSRNKPVHILIPINNDFSHLSIEVLDLDARSWLFACAATSKNFIKSCDFGWNLTNRTRILPGPRDSIKRSVDLELREFRERFGGKYEVTHIVVLIPEKIEDSPIIHTDLYNVDDTSRSRLQRTEETAASLFKNPFSVFLPTFDKLKLTLNGNKYRHFVELNGISDAVSVLLRRVTKIDNRADDDDFKFVNCILELVEPQLDNENSIISQIRMLTIENVNERQVFRLQTTPSNSSLLKMTLTPGFSFEFEISRAGIFDRMSVMVRDRWERLLPLLVSLCLLIISTRIDLDPESEKNTVILTTLMVVLLNLTLETMVSLGFITIFALWTCFTVVFSGSLIHNTAARFLGRAIRLFPVGWYNWLLKEGVYEHLPILSSILVVSVISTSCGAIAVLISVIIYLLKLTHMYEEYLEELLMASLRIVTRKLDKFFETKRGRKRREEREDDEDVDSRTNIINHLVIFIMWSTAAVAAVPSVLVWAKNFSHQSRLTTEDPIMLASWTTMSLLGSLGLVRIPIKHTNQWINTIGVNFQRLLGWSLLLTASSVNPVIYQWTIPPVVALSVLCLVVLSQLSRFREKAIENDDSHVECDNGIDDGENELESKELEQNEEKEQNEQENEFNKFNEQEENERNEENAKIKNKDD